MLDDVNAIRAVNQAYARHINAGAREEIAALFADPSDAQIDGGHRRSRRRRLWRAGCDRDRLRSSHSCCALIADAEEIIGPSCPLVEMAREQGGGLVRRTKRVVFEHRLRQTRRRLEDPALMV